MAKIKVFIETEEIYPVYLISKEDDGWGDAIEIDQTLFSRYKKVMSAFESLQVELAEILLQEDKPKP